jgi:hypothetical protein
VLNYLKIIVVHKKKYGAVYKVHTASKQNSNEYWKLAAAELPTI